MDLPLNPILPLGGIALILTLVWLTGGRRQASLTAPADAAAVLAAPEVGFAAIDIAMARDGSAALARDAAGHIAVVFASGAKLATRKLEAADIAAVTLTPQADGLAQLGIRTHAFTHPNFTLLLDAAAAEDWRHHLTERA